MPREIPPLPLHFHSGSQPAMPTDSLFQSEFRYVEDLSMIGRALRGRWEISDEDLAKVAKKAVELTQHDDTRVAIKACQVVTQMVAQIQKDDHKRVDVMTAESRKALPTTNNFTQIAVGDLGSIYELLDRMSGPSASDAVLEAPVATPELPASGT